MTRDPLFIVQWAERLLTNRKNFEWAWRDIADYILINKTGIDDTTSPGRKRTTKLFDATATRALKRLASMMHGSLTSSSLTWFKLRMRDGQLNRIKRVRLWLEDAGDLMLQEFGNSNFSSEAQEIYTDLIGFGTAALFSEESAVKAPGIFPGMNFISIPVGTFVIDEAPDGKADVLFRWLKMNAWAIQRRFPAATLPEDIKRDADKKKDTQYEIIHGIFPREGGVSAPSADVKTLPYASMYICKKNKTILKESGYHEFPVQVPRWSKLSGEVYGRGPSHETLPDIKTLNKAVELSLKAFGKAIDPPMKARHDGIVGGEVRLTAGGITYVTEMDALEALELGSKWDVVKFKIEDLRDSIERSYLTDHIQLKDSPQMTAEEVRTRQEQMIRLLGPTLGRMESEFLNPLIQRTFNVMYRAGVIPKPPAEVLDSIARGAGEIDIEYTGPLSRGQRINEVYAIERIYQLAQPIATVNPGVLDVIDADEAIRVAGEVLGAPERVVRDEKKVAAIREDRAEAQAEADDADKDRLDAGTAKDLKAAEPESDDESEDAQVLRLIQGGKA
jgi:hypothetical protein